MGCFGGQERSQTVACDSLLHLQMLLDEDRFGGHSSILHSALRLSASNDGARESSI